MNEAGGSVGATFGAALRNVWLVGLGVVAVAKSIDLSDFKARVEQIVDERIAAALDRLEVPRREDLHELSRRIDVLAAEQKRQG